MQDECYESRPDPLAFGGAGPQVLAMISGQVPIGFAAAASFAVQVKAGHLRGLAVTADKRISAFPDIPATGEIGITGLSGDTFLGLFTRAGAPTAVLTRLHGEITRALAMPDVRERIAVLALCGNTREQFSAQVKSDIQRWGNVLREAGIKVD